MNPLRGTLSANQVGMFLVAVLAIIPVSAQEAPVDKRKFAPDTISEQFKDFYASIGDPALAPVFPGPDDLDTWQRIWEASEVVGVEESKAEVNRLGVEVTNRVISGVPVMEVMPKGWEENGKRLIYAHGGAYVLSSAKSTLGGAALAATATGLRVVSVDYTNPPRATWQEVTGQLAGVIHGLNDEGFGMSDLVMFGDSAGGGLAAGVAHQLRDEGRGIPAALVLWSPWADITETGDTYQTLKDVEPMFLYEKVLGPAANAYADPEDQKHPYVSPVYGDFTQGYPPTLIQVGTREIFLSNAVRLYRAIDRAGSAVVLDVYEGMPHDFQLQRPEAPETMIALDKMREFVRQYLGM